MFDYDKIRQLKDELVVSLYKCRSKSDGLFRSSPTTKTEFPPSFTNSGIVLKAFVESGFIYYAQELATHILNYKNANKLIAFPHEKAINNEKGHIMSNAWIVSALLDCLPIQINKLADIKDWFLQTQREDHAWDLLPSEETKYPVFTAFSINTLLKYRKFLAYTSVDQNIESIDNAIQKGIDFLLENTSFSEESQNYYLWPASLYSTDKENISFNTSLLCIHVIRKASHIYKREDWQIRADQTIDLLANSIEKDFSILMIDGKKLLIWDQIHVNESSLNYFYSFFAPLSIVPLLNSFVSNRPDINFKILDIVKYLSNWIEDHISVQNDIIGVRPSDSTNEIKTWSTAQSVIALGRLLNKRFEISSVIETQNIGKVEYEFFLELEDTLKGKIISPASKRIILAIIFIFLATIWYLMFRYFKNVIQKNWNDWESVIWFVSILISAFFIIGGFNFSVFIKKIRENIISWLYRYLFSFLTLIDISKLIKKVKSKSRN